MEHVLPRAVTAVPVVDSLILAPVVTASKVLGVGMNFRSFVDGIGERPPDDPVLFHKTRSSLIGHGAVVHVPSLATPVVQEGELAVVIGVRATAVDETTAMEFVAGFACANDISARDLEFRTSQWTPGKMIDRLVWMK